MRKHRLFVFVVLSIAILLVAACAGQSQTEGEPTSQNNSKPVVEVTENSAVAATHTEDDGHDGDGDGAGHADEAPMVEAMHMEGDSHAAAEHVEEASHMEADEHGEADDHVESEEHGVPAEAMAVENPVAATAETIAAGAASYTQYCAVCHGNEGKGDGLGAAGLNPKPADFSEEHVQVLSDGGLFWFITNGVPDSAMPPWGGALSEQQRWELVNFLRTFKNK